VLDAYRLAKRYSSRTELWVLSAGYGLSSCTRAIKPYSATFASRSPDSVWRGEIDGKRTIRLWDWWDELPHQATLPDLVQRSEQIVIAAGAAYLTAIARSLNKIGGDQVAVISAGLRGHDWLLPVNGGLRAVVGGTYAVLNARLLALIAAESATHRFSPPAMADLLSRLAGASPSVGQYRPSRSLTDAEVAHAISSIRQKDASVSRTGALRRLRSQGFACEYDRFRRLWGKALET
jgi:hypothetical protein